MASTIQALLIEDNPGDAFLMQEMVDGDKKKSMSIEWADSLEQGIDRALNEDFDVVLLDLDLPDSRGVDSVSTTHVLDSGLPIVVVTGRKDGDTAFEAIRRGAQDYLLKGQFDYDELLKVVRFAIERKILQDRLDAERDAGRVSRNREVYARALLCPSGKAYAKVMAKYLTMRMDRGDQILYVALDQPLETLLPAFAAEGVDTESMQFLDATGADSASMPNVSVIGAQPTAEAMGLRIEKLCSVLGPDTHVILDSLNELLLHDSFDTVAVFTHFMANRLRLLEIAGDFVANQTDEWEVFSDQFSSFLDEEVEAGAVLAAASH